MTFRSHFQSSVFYDSVIIESNYKAIAKLSNHAVSSPGEKQEEAVEWKHIYAINC